MTSYPSFVDPQFVDANGVGGLNAAFGTVSGAIASAGSGVWAAPGLIAPEAMTVFASGLVVSGAMPLPWGLVTASGALVHAHGGLTGSDSQSYSASFSALVPSTGSVTAYLVATPTSIQQNPFPIPGPPPGHPSYNPNFVPTIGYATNVYSVAVSATSGTPDNVSTFELLRTTLIPSQTVISSWTTAYQRRAVNRTALPTAVVSGGALTVAQAQTVLYPATAGLTSTLPPVSGAGGLTYHFVNETGANWTIAAAGSDNIFGLGGAGFSSVVVPSPGFMDLWGYAAQGAWHIRSTSPNSSALFASQASVLSGTTSITAAQAGTYFTVGGVSTTQTLPTAASTPGLTFGFYAVSGCTIATSTGAFEGGALTGSTSVALNAGEWLAVQSDNTNYRMISASPGLIGSSARSFAVSGATSALQATNLGQFPSSLGSAGYKKYPDINSPSGYFIEQWGRNIAPVTVIFPIVFPNAVVGVQMTVIGYPGYNGDTVQADGTAVNGFVAYGGNPVGGAGAVQFFWRAIGW